MDCPKVPSNSGTEMHLGQGSSAAQPVLSLLPSRGPRFLGQAHLSKSALLRRTRKQSLCQVSWMAESTEGGGREAHGPKLGTPSRKSWEKVPGRRILGGARTDKPASPGRGGQSWDQGLLSSSSSTCQHPKSRPGANLRHSLLQCSTPLPLLLLFSGIPFH